MSGTSRLNLTPRVPVSRESMDRRPPRLIANDFSTPPILSNGVAKSEPLSDSALILRERELRDREERLRRRELEFERSQAVCSTRDFASSYNACNEAKPQWVTLDECLGADTSKWDSSAVSETLQDCLLECDRESSKEHRQQTEADCYRNRELNERSSSRGNSEEVSQLIEALHSMTNSVNCRSAKPLGKEDRFDGNPVKYRRLIKQFESYVLRGVHHASNKLELLISSCSGQTREDIEDCIMADSSEIGYLEARRILETNYGQSHVVVDAYVRAITEGPFIRSGDSEGLAKLASSMRNCLIACSGLPSAGLDTQHTVGSVFKRLPKGLQEKFMSEVSNELENNKLITFKDLTGFVERHASMERSFLGQLSLSKGDRKHDHDRRQEPLRKKKVFTTFSKTRTETPAQQTPSCPECKKNHGIWRCPVFQKLSVQDRWKSVKLNRLCFNCLERHISRNCKSDGKCRKCGRRHHTMLHSDNESGTSIGSGSSSDSAEMVELQHGTCTSGKITGIVGCKVWLKVIPVTVWGVTQRRCVTTYDFLDEGSDVTLCTQRLADQLNLKGTKICFSLATISGTEQRSGIKVDLNLRGVNDQQHILSLQDVVAVPALPDLRESVPDHADIERYSDLLQNAAMTCLQNKSVELLIGADVQAAHRQLEYRIGPNGGPNAVRTALGWTLVGPEAELDQSKRLRVNFVRLESHLLHEQLQRMYDTDFVTRTSTEEPYSSEDRRAVKLMEDTVERVNGHYQIGLPWKSDNLTLPNNRAVAVKRLNHLKHRFVKDLEFFDQYRERMTEYLDLGYARKIPSEALAPGPRSWYIPHHATRGKFRIVFDCGATYRGTSLNNNLLPGPDQTSRLVGVLLRFRSGPVAVMADVKGMFHQVKVCPEDSDSLRFLWWPDKDLSVEPEEF